METEEVESGENNNRMGKEEEDPEEDHESPFKNCTFNIFDALFVLISMGLLVADLVTGEFIKML